MKKFYSLAFLAFVLLGISAQAQQDAVKVMSSNDNSLRMVLTPAQMSVSTIVFATDTFSRIEVADFAGSTAIGRPDLPVLSKMVEIPVGASVRVNVVGESHKTVSGESIGLTHRYLPTQPARRKSDTSAPVLSIDEAAYSTNAFYANELVSVEYMGVARDRNLAIIHFSPIQYNPVTNEVVIYSDVELSLEFEGGDIDATRALRRLHGNGAFGAGIHTVNSLSAAKDLNVSCPIRYTIIAHSSFRGQMDTFVAWKKRQGFLVDIHYTDESAIGTTTTSITNYLQSQYTNATAAMPAPTYVLLVGDNAQIPAYSGRNSMSSSWSSGRISDLYYFTWTSGDNVPDCYYGRFSAQTVAQLTPQIEKTLTYEQYQFQSPAFLDKALLVAGTDQGNTSDNGYTYADPTMDYIAKNYVNGDHRFTQVHYYKNNSSSNPNASNVTVYSNGGYSAYSSSNSVAQAVKSEINEGRGWFNYSAHGDWDGFSIPAFGNDQVSSLSATNKYGVIIGNCCLTNSFQQSSCFGETLLRKSGAGAVAYIGASDYTYWGQDFYWAVGYRTSVSNPSYQSAHLGCYDRMNHTHGEAFSTWATTVGSLMYAGNMAVQEAGNSTYAHYYWEVYHLMGDPSLQPYMGQADNMPLDFLAAVPFSSPGFNVTTAPYAFVALTQNGEMVASMFADANGSASFPMSQLSIGVYELAVSAQNYKPAFRDVTIVAADGPYVMGSNLSTDDVLSPGSIVSIHLDLENLGNATASNIDVVVNGDPAFVTPIRNHTQAVNLTPDYTFSIDDEFYFLVNADVEDGAQCQFQAVINWGTTDTSYAVRSLSIEAPRFEMLSSSETHTSNSVTINCQNTNSGHADASDVEVDLFCGHPAITITNPHANVGDVDAGSNFATSYSINVASTFTGNHAVQFLQRITDGVVTRIDTIYVTLSDGTDNGNARQFEGFESGNFSAYDWTNSNPGWIVTSSGKRSGTYCAKSNIEDQHSTAAELSLVYTSTSNDSIAFYYKVSSESRYDKFHFYIDGEEKMNASGTNQSNYTRVAYAVTAGTHEYTFVYDKDGSVSNGDDCAWIDDIYFPRTIVQDLYIYDTICQGASYTFRGQSLSTELLAAGSHLLQVDLAEGGIAYITLQVGIDLSLSSDITIEKGESVILIASGASTYEWSTGHTSSAIAVAPSQTTTYTVTGHVGSCSEQASVTVTVNASSQGIADVETASVSIYPNPAATQVTVEAENLVEVRLLNTLGQCLQVLRPQGSRLVIEVSALPSGIYLVEALRADGTSSLHKLIRK